MLSTSGEQWETPYPDQPRGFSHAELEAGMRAPRVYLWFSRGFCGDVECLSFSRWPWNLLIILRDT